MNAGDNRQMLMASLDDIWFMCLKVSELMEAENARGTSSTEPRQRLGSNLMLAVLG